MLIRLSLSSAASRVLLLLLLFTVPVAHFDVLFLRSLVPLDSLAAEAVLTRSCRQTLGKFLTYYHISYRVEYFINIMSSFSRCFKKQESMLISELFAFSRVYDLILSIALICDEYFGYVVVCVLLDLLEPVRDVVEGLLVGAVVDQDYAHCSLVISLGYGAETLLTCCVPNL